MQPQPIGITADQWADAERQLSADVRESQAGMIAGVRADNAVALSLNKNPEFLANLPMPAARYEEPAVRNVPRPAVVANRDPVLDYARANIGDFWRDGIRQAGQPGLDRQFSDGFDGLLASPAGAPPRAVPGQQMSDALYLAGPIPVARYDLGIASLTVNGGLNFINGLANAGLNALEVLTEPVDRFQGEIMSLETGIPGGALALGPTAFAARISPWIRAQRELNAGRVLAENALTIASNPATGNPAAIARGIGVLNSRQVAVLDQLSDLGSRTITSKAFGQTDLAALTAATGDEFAMFSTGGRRLIIRGDSTSVPITPEIASELSSKGWRWSSHVHPGFDTGVLRSSIGDRAVLEATGGNQSAIFNSLGQRRLFTPAGDSLNGWTPW